MTDAVDIERQLDRWFAGEDPGPAPDRVLTGALDAVRTTGQRRSIRSRLQTGTRLTGWQRAFALGLIVLASLVAALLVGGALQRDDPQPLRDADLVVLREGRIVAIALDGTERELGRLTDEMLGSPVRLIIRAAVSPDGHLMVYRIKDDQTAGLIVFDLRHLDAPPSEPDVEGTGHGFSANGTIGMVTSDGIATFDPLTGGSRTTTIPTEDGTPTYRPLTPDGGVKWALDGSGILAETGRFTIDTEGTVTTATIGRLGPDGTFTAGAAPAFDDGLFARRFGPGGEVLRCRREADEACYFEGGELWAVTGESATSVWINPDASTRITDFSWALDGGLWLLLEPVAAGPGDVSLVYVSPTDEVRTVATFQADVADPDPNLYYPSAFFAAIAPDNSRLVIYLTVGFDRRVPYLVHPSGGEPERIDREIVGWLVPGAIQATRPSVAPIPVTDPVMRGLWTDGVTTLRLGTTRLDLNETDVLALEAVGPDTVAIRGSGGDLGCPPEVPGIYRWSLDAGRLTLAAVDEPCVSRTGPIEGRFEASIPITGGVPAIIKAGARVRSSIVGVPLSVTIPTSGSASVQRHLAQDLTLLGPMVGEPVEPGVVSVFVPTGAVVDPCGAVPSGLEPLAPGIDGVIAYIDGLQARGIRRSELTESTFAGSPAVAFDLVFDPTSCPGILFRNESDSGFGTIQANPRLTVIQHPDGPVVIVSVGMGAGSGPEGVAWVDELVSSISFEPLE